MLGAVLGDALAMPYEIMSSRDPEPLMFKKAHGGHPNEELMPGQYTDDGQIILMAARTLVESESFNRLSYASELLRTYKLNKFRFADGAILSACRKMESSSSRLDSGINTDTTGCIGLAVPFALGYRDRKEMAQALSDACNITHTSISAKAGVIGLALLLNTLIETGDLAVSFNALDNAAANMYPDLKYHLEQAYHAVDIQMPVSAITAHYGNTSQVTQVLPLAAYLIRSIPFPEDLLSTAVSCGGNCGTVSMICGAIIGAKYGITALPLNLVCSVERAGIFEELAESLCNRAYPEV